MDNITIVTVTRDGVTVYLTRDADGDHGWRCGRCGRTGWGDKWRSGALDGAEVHAALCRKLPARQVPSAPPARRWRPIDAARAVAAERNARMFGTHPSWYGQ